jgi:hypothetical protein
MSGEQFSHEHREGYFRKIFNRIPQKSLVFLDPDIGIEEKKPTVRHLLGDELKTIADTMDTRSILMIYQHFPRRAREGYLRERCDRITDLTTLNPVVITDNEIVFFLLAKNPKLRQRLEDNVAKYANTYPALRSCGCM